MYTLEIVPGFYQITVRYTNMFLAAEKDLTLIDTGFRGSMPAVVELVRKLGRKPEEIKLVILTHNHLDHTGGLEELRKLAAVKVAAHRADVNIPEGIVPYPAGDYLGKMLKARVFSPLRRRLVLDEREVDIRLEGGEVFDIMGGLKVVPTPGHTAGSISLYAPAHKLLIAGDALNKRWDVLRMPLKTVSTDLEVAAASIRKMAELDVEILCVGHGRPIMRNARVNLRALVSRLDA
jgi:glyoxylase-like metal-dependent hydrolase (beta-lactamase superfamily II)